MTEIDDKIANTEAELVKAKNVLEVKPDSEYFATRKTTLEKELKQLKKQKAEEKALVA